MFLFEKFTYVDSWAAANYNNFYDSSDYFDEYLNYPDSLYIFKTKKRWDREHLNNRYTTEILLKSDIFSNKIPREAYEYVINKLKELGNCIDIDEYGFKPGTVTFHYSISLDEKRWVSEHKRIYDQLDDDSMTKYIPNMETWLQMINAKFSNQNPNLLFKKITDITQAGAKYIVALKMDWYYAYTNLEERISELITTGNFLVPSELIKLLRTYANEKYEVPEEVKDILEAYSSAVKNKSNTEIPPHLLKVVKKLDNNAEVQSYELSPHYDGAINITTTNGNTGRIYIEKEDDGTYKGLWRVALKLPGKQEESLLPSTFPAVIKSSVDSAVRAIYKNDPKQLHIVVIKLQQ